MYRKKWRQNHKDYWNNAIRKYQLDKEQRTPVWADQEKILEFYIKAVRLTKETGIKYSVDHIIPIHGKNVSGLHIETNLQVITLTKNCQKRNNY